MKKLVKNTLLIVASIVLFQNVNAQNVEQVGPIKAKLIARNDGLMIDVREKSEVEALAYDVEHSVNIPLSQFESKLKEIPKDKKLVMVCASGNRSQKAAEILVKNGYTNVVNMTGGIAAWQAKKLEVKVKGKSVKKGACCANPNSKDCNPDGSCKPKSEQKKSCCSNPSSKKCNPNGTCKPKK